MVEARPRLYATEMYSEESSFQQYVICGNISQRLVRKSALWTEPPLDSEILLVQHNTAISAIAELLLKHFT